MMPNLISIQQAVDNFKALIEGSILQGGIVAKEAMIRSSRPINNIHEAVKTALIIAGIEPHRIFPPLGVNSPEMKLAGFLNKSIKMCALHRKVLHPQTKL